MQPCENIENLLPLFLSGDLNRDEQLEVKEHLQNCEKCRQYQSSLKAIITTMEKDTLAVPTTYGAELVVKLNKRLDRRKARQRWLTWTIPAFTTTLAVLLMIGISLLKPESAIQQWIVQFDQEHSYLNLLDSGYFGEILLDDNSASETGLSVSEIYQNAVYRIVESHEIPEMDSYLMATANLSDGEFKQVIDQLKSEIL